MALVLAVHVLLVVAAALVAGNAGPRRALGLTLGGLALVPAWFLPAELPALRAGIELGGVLCLLRVIDLARDRRTWSPARRLWHVVGMFDTRKIKRAPPRFAASWWAATVAYAGLAAAGLWSAHLSAPLASPWSWALRWLCGAVFCYAMRWWGKGHSVSRRARERLRCGRSTTG